jgi:membrane-associated protease RseP (regulator of RpoE activity)
MVGAMFVLWPIFAAANAVVLLTARRLVGRRLGRREIRFLPWRERESDVVPRSVVALLVLVPFAICYLVATVPFTAALAIGGRRIPSEEIPPVVSVRPGLPAEAAGIRDGDRIVAVDGAVVASWVDMATAIRARPGEKITFLVDRDGAEHDFTVAISDEGFVGIEVRDVITRVSFGEALGRGFVAPVTVVVDLVAYFYELVFGTFEAELEGPIAIVRVAEQAPETTLADHLRLVAQMNAYLGVPSALLMALLFRPRRRAQVNQRGDDHEDDHEEIDEDGSAP